MIGTDRLVLRAPVDADRDAIAAINADPRVGAWLGGVRDRAASDDFVDRIQAQFAQHGFGFYVVERRADRRVIGLTGIWHVPDDNPMVGQVEIGWRYAPDAWGQGYATEAARAALDYGFDLGIDEIIAFTARTNLASQAVMRRLGMTYDPARDFEHPQLTDGDPLRPHVVFAARPKPYPGGEA
ncbi:MAG: GNAT family N-acetyltransferase [Caulobacter sp.]|nr:GNAT family N-acetyltransferase [Caulobacter sp.]